MYLNGNLEKYMLTINNIKYTITMISSSKNTQNIRNPSTLINTDPQFSHTTTYKQEFVLLIKSVLYPNGH